MFEHLLIPWSPRNCFPEPLTNDFGTIMVRFMRDVLQANNHVTCLLMSWTSSGFLPNSLHVLMVLCWYWHELWSREWRALNISYQECKLPKQIKRFTDWVRRFIPFWGWSGLKRSKLTDSTKQTLAKRLSKGNNGRERELVHILALLLYNYFFYTTSYLNEIIFLNVILFKLNHVFIAMQDINSICKHKTWYVKTV